MRNSDACLRTHPSLLSYEQRLMNDKDNMVKLILICNPKCTIVALRMAGSMFSKEEFQLWDKGSGSRRAEDWGHMIHQWQKRFNVEPL